MTGAELREAAGSCTWAHETLTDEEAQALIDEVGEAEAINTVCLWEDTDDQSNVDVAALRARLEAARTPDPEPEIGCQADLSPEYIEAQKAVITEAEYRRVAAEERKRQMAAQEPAEVELCELCEGASCFIVIRQATCSVDINGGRLFTACPSCAARLVADTTAPGFSGEVRITSLPPQ